MAKIGYIMAISQYNKLENIDGWMNDYIHVKGLEKRDEYSKPIHFKF